MGAPLKNFAADDSSVDQLEVDRGASRMACRYELSWPARRKHQGWYPGTGADGQDVVDTEFGDPGRLLLMPIDCGGDVRSDVGWTVFDQPPVLRCAYDQ